MLLHRLSLEHFRNIEQQTVTFTEGINVITGANAQGKTNLIEAIAYWSAARSHRTQHETDLIQTGKPAAYLKAEFESQGRHQQLEATLLRSRQRKLLQNGVQLRTLRELIGILPSVLFSPADLELVQEGPAARRQLMDMVLCQVNPAYMTALGRYNKVLKQKQKLLRNDHHPDVNLFQVYNAQLAKNGALLIHRRVRFLDSLHRLASEFHTNLSRGLEVLSMQYKTVSVVHDPYLPVEQLEQQLNAHFALRLPQELACRICLTGPQRDDFLLYINKKELKVFSSQGQARTAAIAIKLAERSFFRQELGEYPLLLLDDVLSELDDKRRRVVLNELSQGQVFISCCDQRRTRALSGRVIKVKKGVFT